MGVFTRPKLNPAEEQRRQNEWWQQTEGWVSVYGMPFARIVQLAAFFRFGPRRMRDATEKAEQVSATRRRQREMHAGVTNESGDFTAQAERRREGLTNEAADWLIEATGLRDDRAFAFDRNGIDRLVTIMRDPAMRATFLAQIGAAADAALNAPPGPNHVTEGRLTQMIWRAKDPREPNALDAAEAQAIVAAIDVAHPGFQQTFDGTSMSVALI